MVEGAETCAELEGMELPAAADTGAEVFALDLEVTRAVGGTLFIVIALSGFSKCSWSGPSPIRIRARESGIDLLCQPWSAC